MSIIDLHTHTFASDGVLLHSELIRRAVAAGYRAIGITDHGDETNLEDLLKKALKAAEIWASNKEITVVPGVEITHVPPERIASVAAWAREIGARVVVVHGETITEPVAPGTNAAATRCPDVDILAHPGLLTPEDAEAAAQNGVLMEITARKGHSAANGRVAAAAAKAGAGLIFGTDCHAPGDFATVDSARTILRAAGVAEGDIEQIAMQIASHAEVSYLIMVSGEFDLIVEILCKDREHLANFLNYKLRKVKGVERTQTFMTLRTFKMAYGSPPIFTEQPEEK